MAEGGVRRALARAEVVAEVEEDEVGEEVVGEEVEYFCVSKNYDNASPSSLFSLDKDVGESW